MQFSMIYFGKFLNGEKCLILLPVVSTVTNRIMIELLWRDWPVPTIVYRGAVFHVEEAQGWRYACFHQGQTDCKFGTI